MDAGYGGHASALQLGDTPQAAKQAL